MDSRAVADALGTDPKTLRRFLRDQTTSFTPVGSGGRYSFTPTDLESIRAEFGPWHTRQTPKPVQRAVPTSARARRKAMTQAERDALVWAEEGPVILADMRNPRVRARVRAAAQAAEYRLTVQLLNAGLHVSQRDRAAA